MASKYCSYCGSTDHDTNYCPHTWNGQINRANLYCSYCGSKTHTQQFCPKVWGGNYHRYYNPKGDYID